MKKVALTNYYNFTKTDKEGHVCPECHRKIKGWALAQCSSCNRFFCRSHMEPSIGHDKKCPHCRERQKTFKIHEPVFSAIKSAENKLNEFRLAESEDLQDKIFASIFGKNNLIKRAQEEDTDQPQVIEQDQPQDTSVPVETTPSIPNEPQINIENAAPIVAKKVSDALRAVGIDPSSNDVANVMNAIAKNTDKKVITSQSTTTPVDQVTQNQGELFGSMMGQIRQDNTPPVLQKWQQLTPEEARRVNQIWDNYVSFWGPNLFRVVPVHTDNDRIINNNRRREIGKMITEIYNAVGTEAKTKAFLRANGLNERLFESRRR